MSWSPGANAPGFNQTAGRVRPRRGPPSHYPRRAEAAAQTGQAEGREQSASGRGRGQGAKRKRQRRQPSRSTEGSEQSSGSPAGSPAGSTAGSTRTGRRKRSSLGSPRPPRHRKSGSINFSACGFSAVPGLPTVGRACLPRSGQSPVARNCFATTVDHT